MSGTLQPLSGQAILVLLLQLAGLLLLARLLAELMRRLGQPAVIGELLAGILLGPSVLGHYAPELFLLAFPQEVAQFHLLEVVSWLGMVLLLLLTGLETDLLVVRALGRPALMASIFGMVVPFAAGLELGWLLPDAYLVRPEDRGIFAAFMATAMAISAVPVIAKILLDLNLLKRNVGVVILSAGVVDDTTGWLVLSIIAGIATAGTFSLGRLGLSLLGLSVYLLAVRWIVFPVLGRALRYVNERVDLVGADLTLILGFTFLSAAATEGIGIHAVFGAFVMGLAVRQIPRVKAASLHTLETFVLSALSPIFFAYVGLKVDLWTLSGWDLPLVVLGVAVAGKLVGCYLGGRLGRMPRWEALALGFGMNARGAMELIVALIGLSLGLLTQEVYATIVLVAVVTSFMAPLLLRAVMPMLPLSEAERRRIEDDGRARLVPPGPLRILVPTAGGDNALAALALAAPLVGSRQGALTALYVETGRDRIWLWRWFHRGSSRAGHGLEHHLQLAADRLGEHRKLLGVRRVRARDPAGAILTEASRDYDLLMLGAAPHHLLGDSSIVEVVNRARLNTVIVRTGSDPPTDVFQRVVVPVDGSVFSRYAVEFAFSYAEPARAHVTLLHVTGRTRFIPAGLLVPEPRGGDRDAPEEVLEARLRSDFGSMAEARGIGWEPRIVASDDAGDTIVEESHSGHYDLLVLGAENKLLAQPLFFGQGTATIVERAGCATAVVVPRLD